MPNTIDTFTRKVNDSFMKGFQSNRILSKNVDTQLLSGAFHPKSGENVDFERAHDYRASETSDGNMAAETKSDIITGKATGTVQDYITVMIDWAIVDQALKMGNLDKKIMPMGRRLATKLELNMARFMMKNAGLLSGETGNAVNTWSEVARAGAVMSAHGVPDDVEWFYTMNPYTQTALADVQRSLGAVDNLVDSAHKKATISSNFAGMRVMTASTQASFTTGAGADRVGTLSASPDVTYLTAKDTMTQVLAVTAFQANLVVAAGEIVRITGRNRLNLSTREAVIDETGSKVLWSGTVTEAVTLNGSGAGNLVVTGPAIFENNGQYNTVDEAPLSGDVITLLGSADTQYQPNMFWNKQAYSIGSVPIPKLFSTDTIADTEDGLQIRISKGADIITNKQIMRFDIHPAFAVLNPFYAGHSYGTS